MKEKKQTVYTICYNFDRHNNDVFVACIAFTTATDEYAERLDRFADTEVYKGLSLTCADVKKCKPC